MDTKTRNWLIIIVVLALVVAIGLLLGRCSGPTVVTPGSTVTSSPTQRPATSTGTPTKVVTSVTPPSPTSTATRLPTKTITATSSPTTVPPTLTSTPPPTKVVTTEKARREREEKLRKCAYWTRWWPECLTWSER